ncbi:MAG TPA: hypothetical protein VGL21_11710 [Jatrophihabitantaceae bacterium]
MRGSRGLAEVDALLLGVPLPEAPPDWVLAPEPGTVGGVESPPLPPLDEQAERTTAAVSAVAASPRK